MQTMTTSAAKAEFANGWRTVLVSAIGMGLGITGLGFYAMGLFVKPLAAEFGWGRAAISGAAFCLQAGIVLTAPLIGRLIDHVGPRRIALASLVALPLAFVALTQLGASLWAYYALWLLVSIAGCGTTPVVWTRAVSARFDTARGLALGLTLMGTGLAAILVPMLLGPLFLAYGWRAGSLSIAGLIAIVGLPVTAWLFRDAPIPAGEPALRDGGKVHLSRHFAMLALAFPLIGIIVAGLIVHLVPLLGDRGMAPAGAVRMASLVGFAVIAGRVIVGLLVDRFHAPLVAFVFLLLPVATCLLLMAGGPIVPAVLLLGLAAGAEIDLLAYLVSRYFPLASYGATYGALLAIFSLGAGIGPVLFGLSFDRTGGYGLALGLSAAAMVVAATIVALLGRYPERA